MAEPIDEHFTTTVAAMTERPRRCTRAECATDHR